MVKTEGRDLLRAYLRAPGAAATLARLLSVSGPSLSAWKAGTSRPTPAYRHALMRVAGIPESAWMTNREREIAAGGPSRKAG